MNMLLDTHTALWWINEYERLSSKAKKMLLSGNHSLNVSIVSVWEIAIKVSIGKMSGLKGRLSW
jgi:PIN domain nuclease of toxin-antitoxin system